MPRETDLDARTILPRRIALHAAPKRVPYTVVSIGHNVFTRIIDLVEPLPSALLNHIRTHSRSVLERKPGIWESRSADPSEWGQISPRARQLGRSESTRAESAWQGGPPLHNK